MNDILPPRRPNPRPRLTVQQQLKPLIPEARLEASEKFILLQDHVTPEVTKKKWSLKRKLLIVFATLLALFLIGTTSAFFWYQQELRPVSSDANGGCIQVIIPEGSGPSAIANLLANKQVIRSSLAFRVYTRFSGTQNSLQAGSYRLSPTESTQDIVKQLVSGKVAAFNLTFYPGATLVDKTNKADKKKVDVTTILKRAGYSEIDIKIALAKTYTHPLFATKPPSADLEGYIYGQTYNFGDGTPVEAILTRTFDEFYVQVQKNNLVDGFKKQGLSLYEGITLASIIQREVSSPDANIPSDDQKQVAQIFFLRLKEGVSLGSDVTYHYAADKRGVARDSTLDDPYNTRIHTGLPPGPISAPGLGALLAVANPAPGNYLFFISGDDNKTYFAHTNEEHQQNVKNHCAIKCSLP